MKCFFLCQTVLNQVIAQTACMKYFASEGYDVIAYAKGNHGILIEEASFVSEVRDYDHITSFDDELAEIQAEYNEGEGDILVHTSFAWPSKLTSFVGTIVSPQNRLNGMPAMAERDWRFMKPLHLEFLYWLGITDETIEPELGFQELSLPVPPRTVLICIAGSRTKLKAAAVLALADRLIASPRNLNVVFYTEEVAERTWLEGQGYTAPDVNLRQALNLMRLSRLIIAPAGPAYAAACAMNKPVVYLKQSFHMEDLVSAYAAHRTVNPTYDENGINDDPNIDVAIGELDDITP